MRRALVALLAWAFGLGVAAPLRAQSPELLDEQRSAWAYRRTLNEGDAAGEFRSVRLPPELLARCQPGGIDIRLVAPDGAEVPYLVERARPRDVEARWPGTLVDSRREARRFSRWTVDLGQPRRFSVVSLRIPDTDFAKAVRAEASPDGAAWRTLAADVGLFDRLWAAGRIHHARVELSEPVVARFLRLTADDTRSAPIQVTSVEVSSARSLAGESWSRPVRLEPVAAAGGVSRYRLAVDPPGLPFESLTLDADAPAFSRRARLLAVETRNGQLQERLLGEAELYRVRVPDAVLATESLTLSVRAPARGELILELRDEDSPALPGLRASVAAAETELVYPRANGAPTLYYGNPVTRAARYDLLSHGARLAGAGPFAEARLGAEGANPRFRVPIPLGFTPLRGAPLESRRWSRQRAFEIGGREDLYSLTLSATDLAMLRPDLADLRVVDAANVQLPFALETGIASERVELRLTPRGPLEPSRGQATRVSRYTLALPYAAGVSGALPLSAVELEVADQFFSRPVRVLDAEAGGRHGPRVIVATVLSRSGREEGQPAPLRLGLDAGRHRELELEVEEGDNAPLAISAARGIVGVPRLAFKAGPGRYRLLLGNPDAQRPRYDIAGLRQDFLTYSALPLQAGPREPNLSHRRSVSDYLREAPPTLLLWGTLAAAVLALLLLTARTLRQPPQP